MRLLEGSPVALREEGPCIYRIVGNVQRARSRFSAATSSTPPSLFGSLDIIETFLSPIKPIPDGWDDEDYLQGL
jgi:hypothetical protein